jgi:hypothetical protein
MRLPARRSLLHLGVVVFAVLLLPVAARGIASRYHDDSLWANAAASVGGVSVPVDFGYVFLPAANEVLADRSPYMDPDAFVGGPQIPYVYPPALALALIPVALLPEHVGGSFLPGVLFSLVLIASVIGALLLLDVRDWRCYPVALAYSFTLEALEYGAVGPILLLFMALGWRYRDRKWGGVALGGAIVLKLFLWPLLVWLVFTRRFATAATACVVAGGIAVASWAVIGFRGLADYPALLSKLVDIEAGNSYSALALFEAAGISAPVSRTLAVALGVALLVASYRASRARRCDRIERDRRSIILAVAAALVLTPILWLHYLVLLILPIALARPRLSGLWFAPFVLSVFELLDWYRGWPNGSGRALLSVALLVALVIGVSQRSRSSAPRVGHAGA